MEDRDFKYIRCQNCGRYFINETEDTNKFCSEDCKIYYKNCESCGNYFITSRNLEDLYCSSECGINPEVLDLLDLQDPQTPLADNQ